MKLSKMVGAAITAAAFTASYAETVELRCAGETVSPDGKGGAFSTNFQVIFFLTKEGSKVTKVQEHGRLLVDPALVTETYEPRRIIRSKTLQFPGEKKTVIKMATQLSSDDTGIRLTASRADGDDFSKSHAIRNTGEYSYKSTNGDVRTGQCVSPEKQF